MLLLALSNLAKAGFSLKIKASKVVFRKITSSPPENIFTPNENYRSESVSTLASHPAAA